MEAKYRKHLLKMESVARRNSNCRHERTLVSCCGCDAYDACKSNNWSDLIETKKELSAQIGERAAWKIERKLREDMR